MAPREPISDDFLKATRGKVWEPACFCAFAWLVGIYLISPWFAIFGVLAAILGVIYCWAALKLWWRLGPRRFWYFAGPYRTRQLHGLFTAARHKAESPGVALIRIEKFKLLDSPGPSAKATVRHTDNGKQEAVFWGHVPSKHQVLLVRVQPSNGGHHNRNLELYLGTKQTGNAVIDILPKAAWRIGMSRPRPAPAAVVAEQAGPAAEMSVNESAVPVDPIESATTDTSPPGKLGFHDPISNSFVDLAEPAHIDLDIRPVSAIEPSIGTPNSPAAND